MIELIALLVTGTAAIGGFAASRRYVRDRLRYVDAVQKTRTAVVAGGLALVAATPVVWLLPVVGAGTALLFGTGVGYGVYKGARDVRGKRGDMMVT